MKGFTAKRVYGKLIFTSEAQPKTIRPERDKCSSYYTASAARARLCAALDN